MNCPKRPTKYKVSYENIFKIMKENNETWLSFCEKIGMSQGELQNMKQAKNINMNTIIVLIEKLEEAYGKKYSIEDIVTIKFKQ